MLKRKIIWSIITLFSIIIAFMSLRYAMFLFSGYPEINPVADAASKGFMSHFAELFHQHKVLFLLHIIGGVIALLVGPFQLSRKLRTHYKRVHRIVGYIYIPSVLAGGIGGISVGFYAFGEVTQAEFIALGSIWIMTLAVAVYAIIKRDFKLHEKWMFANFSLTFAAVTLRLELFPLMLEYDIVTAYQIVSWLCWVPNLILGLLYKGHTAKLMFALTE
ncbi:MAG TPA: DUF2306 domain-containing protein [Spirochaetes bacterium]|nr:DUF2306 domain-containing protein [Spirochaetota bacterium]